MAEANGKPIVVAVDGSAPGWEAMETALSLAHLLNRPVEVLTVIQRRKSGYFAFIDRHLVEEQHSYGVKILEEAGVRAQKAAVAARTHLLEGEKDVSEAILAFLDGGEAVRGHRRPLHVQDPQHQTHRPDRLPGDRPGVGTGLRGGAEKDEAAPGPR